MCRIMTPEYHLTSDGREFELEVLGRCPLGFRGDQEKWLALAQVRQNQPARKTNFIVTIEGLFASQGINCRFYTAVSTTLDRHFHIDAFVEFYGEVFTLDLTKNTEKSRAGVVDVVFGPEEVKNPLRFVVQLVNAFSERKQRASRVCVMSMQRPVERRVRVA